MRLPVLAALVVAFSAYAQAPQVVTRPLAEVAVYPERDASAQSVALNESRVAAEITGRIVEIAAEVGARLPRGAVLARLDCRDHELAAARAAAQLEASRSRLALAEQQLARARDLQERKFLSAEALAGRETEARVFAAEVEQARTALASARHAVEKCVVRAPFEAIVRQRLADVGELAVPGTQLVVLLDAVRLEVAAQVQARDAASLARARAIRFEGDGGTRSLKLLRISPAIDPQARTVEARLAFAQAPAAPGAAGRIIWRDSRPYLPASLIVRRAGELGVFVDDGGTARFVALPGAQEGRPVPVDLPAGALLVVSGHLALQDGARLQ